VDPTDRGSHFDYRPGEPPRSRGRRLSRTGARKQIEGSELRRQLEADGIVVRCASNRGLAEEAPFAYKDVERVVDVVEQAGLARRVVRLVPIGVVKG
jgi:tRNA-splicing ligase RtcB